MTVDDFVETYLSDNDFRDCVLIFSTQNGDSLSPYERYYDPSNDAIVICFE